MKLLHGSAQDIQDGFSLFDYVLKDGEAPEGFIDNGNDAEGPGIYTLPGDAVNYAKSLKGVSCYCGEGDGGYIYVINVDVDDDVLMNNRDADEIESGVWASVIERFIEIRQEKVGYDAEKAREILDRLDIQGQLDDKGEVDVEAMNTALGEIDDFPIDNIDLEDYSPGDGYQLVDEILYDYKINNDPCANIEDEGGPHGIADYAIRSSDNLWGTLCKIWNCCAINNTGQGAESFNRTFQNAVFEVIKDEFDLTATQKEPNGIVVVFDTSAISVEKVIELNRNLSSELGL